MGQPIEFYADEHVAGSLEIRPRRPRTSNYFPLSFSFVIYWVWI